MKIDRHNYEEYFILYVDKELTKDLRLAVEEFVSQNPDLEQELEMLKLSTLTPDTSVEYAGKEKLVKQENGSFIDMTNYEEWLLLYIDNELNADQRLEVENFVLKNQQVKQEFDYLQKSRLEPEEKVLFPDKAFLYRSEKVFAKSVGWWRLAAAAIVLFAISAVGLLIFNKHTIEGPQNAITINEIPGQNKKSNSIVSNKQLKPVEKNSQQPATEDQIHSGKKIINSSKQEIAFANKKKLNIELQSEKIQQKTLVSQKDSDYIHEDFKNIVKSDILNTPIATTVYVSSTNKDVLGKIINSRHVTTGDGYAYNTIDASENNNKRFRGFLRKATRVFERTTKITATDENDRLLIGSFAVKL